MRTSPRSRTAALAAAFVLGTGCASNPAARAPVQTTAQAPAAAPARPAPKITSPKQEFGFDIGDDYRLADYTQLVAYWKKLAAQSDRMKLVSVGSTAEGREMFMAIITSPENQAKLDRYKEISRKLALASGLTDAEAMALAREGKTVVWIDGGLHATEVLGAQQLIQTVYELVSRTDPETVRILNDDIVLCILVNPDGMELVSDWYNRTADTLARSTSGIPRLYQKYTGHDNNRDFFMANQVETQNMNRIMYREWFPQIVYNHHQTGPEGTVMFSPPFRDPFNYNFDPIVPEELDMVGAAMHTRFVANDMPGVTTRSGANYSTWWNGGLRTMPYFHNMIGLLTEAIGNPTPIDIPLVPDKQLPHGDLPYPIAPHEKWHFRQSIAYELTANRAVLDFASRYREHLLYNIYQMGRNSIERGSRDSWTITAHDIDSLKAAIERDRRAKARAAGDSAPPAPAPSARFGRGVDSSYFGLLRKPENRDARGYIIPSDQADFPRAAKFVNILIKGGVEVQRATADFTVSGKRYPAGSYVVLAAQAFRPHVLDMFEPQDHPNDFAYPGGPPKPPYDITGWTPALTMGLEFDRVVDGFEGPFAPVADTVTPPPGKVIESASARGYFLSHAVNNGIIAVNRLLAAGNEVYWITHDLSANGQSYPEGTIYIPASSSATPIIQRAATELGLTFTGVDNVPSDALLELKPVRVGLWDEYGGSIPSGWVRWIFDQYEIPYQVVYPKELDAGNLHDKFDVLVFVDGAIPESDRAASGRFGRQPDANDVPAEYRDRLGKITVAKTVPNLRDFLQAGGTVLTIGSSTVLAKHLGLPITDALVKPGTDSSLAREQFFIPGSVLEASVDNGDPLAYGVPDSVAVLFDHSPAFRIRADSTDTVSSVKRVAWYASPAPLRSGWAWGQKYLDQAVAIAEARVGKGKLFIFGPEITFRGQPHGTFPFLFNAIYYGPASSKEVASAQ
ncbi:MAG TPA: M14 metallopeptidase family protein [Gemmatimonadaceae bacterium]